MNSIFAAINEFGSLTIPEKDNIMAITEAIKNGKGITFPEEIASSNVTPPAMHYVFF